MYNLSIKMYNLSDQYEFYLQALLVTFVTNMRFDEINKISHHRENLEIKSAATNRNGNSCVSLKKAKGRFICTQCTMFSWIRVRNRRDSQRSYSHIYMGINVGHTTKPTYQETHIPTQFNSFIVGGRRKRKEDINI